MFLSIAFVLDTPDTTGSHQTAGSSPAPRESPPSEVLSELSPLRDPPVKGGCGWTGVSLSPLPVMAVPGAARYLQLVVSRSCGVGNTRLKSMVGICLPLAPQIMAQPLMWLMLITTAKGMYLMNGYSVVKDQAKGHPVDRLSPNVLKTGGCQPCSSKKFFNLAIARLRDFATA